MRVEKILNENNNIFSALAEDCHRDAIIASRHFLANRSFACYLF